MKGIGKLKKCKIKYLQKTRENSEKCHHRAFMLLIGDVNKKVSLFVGKLLLTGKKTEPYIYNLAQGSWL